LASVLTIHIGKLNHELRRQVVLFDELVNFLFIPKLVFGG
jgi:hypothetical protein